MSFVRNEETGVFEYIPSHRTPEERRRKTAFNEACSGFLFSCFIITVYQLIKLFIFARFGSYLGLIGSPICTKVNLFLMAVFYWYTALIFFINRRTLMEYKWNPIKAMFGFVYVGVHRFA